MAASDKRLGEEWFFSGAFVVFYHISAIFLVFCLEVKINFVYLQTERYVAIKAALIITIYTTNAQFCSWIILF